MQFLPLKKLIEKEEGGEKSMVCYLPFTPPNMSLHDL